MPQPSLDELYQSTTSGSASAPSAGAVSTPPASKPSLDDLYSQSTDQRGGDFNAQMTKEMYEHVPFGKRLVGMLPDADKINKDIESTPAPTNLAGQAGSMAGKLLSFAPAFEAGGALAGGAKMLGGAIGYGGQVAQEGLNKGEPLQQAAKEGATDAAGAYVGGKLLEGAGKAITVMPQAFRDTSGRIHDYIVKVPTKAFSYGKDPLGVLQKEGIQANTIGDYAKSASDRLEQRTGELNDAVANSDAKINLQYDVNNRINSAIKSAQGSLKSNPEIIDSLKDMQANINKKYGDISDLSLQDAVGLKRQLADDFPFSPMEAKNSSANILAKAAHQIHHDINSNIDENAPEVGELNDRVSSLIDISKAAQNRLAIESRQNPVGLIGSLVGLTAAGAGAGQFAGGHPIEGGLTAALAMKAMSSPAVLTRVANALSQLSKVDQMNLFKVVPAFRQVASKAMDFVSNKIQPEMASTGSVKPNPLEAEVVQGTGPKTSLPNLSPKLGISDQSGPINSRFQYGTTEKRPFGAFKRGDVENSQPISSGAPESPYYPSKEAIITPKSNELGNASTKALAGAATLTAAGATTSNAMSHRFKEGHTFTGQASTYNWGEKGLNNTLADNTPMERNSPTQVFAAMSSIPMHSVVEVKDLKTGKTIEVQTKDFGPGKRTHRVIDLSQGAWRQLGYSRPGLTNVKVTIKKLGTGRHYNGKY